MAWPIQTDEEESVQANDASTRNTNRQRGVHRATPNSGERSGRCEADAGGGCEKGGGGLCDVSVMLAWTGCMGEGGSEVCNCGSDMLWLSILVLLVCNNNNIPPSLFLRLPPPPLTLVGNFLSLLCITPGQQAKGRCACRKRTQCRAWRV